MLKRPRSSSSGARHAGAAGKRSRSGPGRLRNLGRARMAQRQQNQRTGGFLGIERKFYDTSISATALTAPTGATGGEIDPGTVNCLSAPAQGDTEQSRDGRKITIKSVQVTGTAYCATLTNLTAGAVGPIAFIALVLDKQSNAAQLNSEDVFTNPGASALLAVSPLRNMQYSSRFRVLAVKQLQLGPDAASYDGTNIEAFAQAQRFEFFEKLNLNVQFTSTTAGIANVVDNSLHVIGFTNSTTLAPTVIYNARIRFVG